MAFISNAYFIVLKNWFMLISPVSHSSLDKKKETSYWWEPVKIITLTSTCESSQHSDFSLSFFSVPRVNMKMPPQNSLEHLSKPTCTKVLLKLQFFFINENRTESCSDLIQRITLTSLYSLLMNSNNH